MKQTVRVPFKEPFRGKMLHLESLSECEVGEEDILLQSIPHPPPVLLGDWLVVDQDIPSVISHSS